MEELSGHLENRAFRGKSDWTLDSKRLKDRAISPLCSNSHNKRHSLVLWDDCTYQLQLLQNYVRKCLNRKKRLHTHIHTHKSSSSTSSPSSSFSPDSSSSQLVYGSPKNRTIKRCEIWHNDSGHFTNLAQSFWTVCTSSVLVLPVGHIWRYVDACTFWTMCPWFKPGHAMKLPPIWIFCHVSHFSKPSFLKLTFGPSLKISATGETSTPNSNTKIKKKTLDTAAIHKTQLFQ